MSNSLLYLAIVAVWAVVLVPMLLRRDAAAAGRRLRLTRRPGELGAHDADYRADDLEDADEHGHDAEPVDTAPGDREMDLAPTTGGYADTPRHGLGRAGLDAYRDARVEADGPPGGPPPETSAPRPVRAGRAAIIARRRRRTTGLAGLLVATLSAVCLGLGPWWTLLPPVLLLAGHLTLLRAAVRMDAERHRATLRRRRAAERHAEEHGSTTPAHTTEDPSAEIIDITAARQEPYDQYADAHLRAVGD